MKKGLSQTLMVTAILVMAAQVMAMAPIISEIPSPVVGDQETATPASTFVFPDAIDLTKYVTDTKTTDSTQIVWSYEVSGDQIYSINGVTPLGPADDPVTATGKIIAGPGALDLDLGNDTTSHTQDADPNTITIRNIALSPIGGPNLNLEVQAPGSNMPQDVTLYASDGELTSATIVTFYTATGKDHMSYKGIPVVHNDFTNGTTGSTSGWAFTSGGVNQITSTVDGRGICMTVGAAGINSLGYWEEEYGEIKLVQNYAYRIRLVLNGTQSAANEVPLWDLLLTNFWHNSDFSQYHGMDLYGAEFWMFDNAGSLDNFNALNGGDGTFDFWWTPPPVLTDRWNSVEPHSGTQNGGPYDPANAADKDAYVMFRIIDQKATRSDLHPEQAVGTMCMSHFSVDRYDIVSTLKADPTVVWQKNSAWSLAPAAPTVAVDSMHFETQSNVSPTWASTGVTLKPTGGSGISGDGSSANCYGKLAPGDNYGYNQGAIFDEPNIVDNFPCAFDAKTLYKVTYMLSAPTQGDEDSPVDALYLGGDTLNSQTIQEGYVCTHAWHCGMPAYNVTVGGVTQPVGTPQPYTLFFYSNHGQSADNPVYWGWRPMLTITNNNAFIRQLRVKPRPAGSSSVRSRLRRSLVE